MIAVVDLARKQKLSLCSEQPPNTIVVPNDGKGFSVYIMTPQPKNLVYSLGGHQRFDIKDGKVIGRRIFAKSCLMFDKSNMPNPTAVFVTTHLLDEIPTEIHVFTMLASGTTIFVSTVKNKTLWSVEQKKVLLSFAQSNISKR